MEKTIWPKVNLSQREKRLGIAAAAVLGGFILCRMFLFPAIVQWTRLSDEVLLRERQWRRGVKLARQRDVIARQWKTQMENRIPLADPKFGAMDFAREASRDAAESGVTLNELRPRIEAERDGKSQDGIDLSLEGSWPGIVFFLAKLRNGSGDFSCKAFHVQRSSEDGSTLRVSLSFE